MFTSKEMNYISESQYYLYMYSRIIPNYYYLLVNYYLYRIYNMEMLIIREKMLTNFT